MKLKLLIILSLFTLQAKADDSSLVHLTAHFGASFAINYIVYGITEKGLGLSQHDSLIIATTTTLAIGLAYKLLEFASIASTSKAMLQNSTGVLASDLTLTVFKW